MYIVKLIPEAESDFQKACEWYEDKQYGLGVRFYKAVSVKFDLIANNPTLYNIRFSERFRFAPLESFPYLISYKIDVDTNTVYIMSVFHTSRNPNKF